MTKEIIYAINVSLDVYSVIISVIIAGSIFIFRKIEKSAKWFALTNIAAILYTVSDIVMWISEGTDAPWKLVALPLSSFFFYFFGITIFFFYIGYIVFYYNTTIQVSKKYLFVCAGFMAVYYVLLFLTPFFGCYYTITPDNVYHRGKLFEVTVVIEIILYLEALLLIIKYHRNAMGFENAGFASFIFIPFITHIIQLANYGIALSSFGLSISFLIIFINLNQKMQHTLEVAKNDFNQKEFENLKRQHITIYYLTNLIENRELETTGHEIRLTKYIELLAEKCYEAEIYPEILTEHYIKMLVEAVPFHDIGKIYIPESILKKPAKFDYAEIEQMKKHVDHGDRIINNILPICYDREFTKIVSQLVKYHHEKWNGRGYPENLKGTEIPLAARFMAIAEAFDAMVTPRCYKKTISYDAAFDIIKKEAGEQFDPLLAEEFLRHKKKIIEITEKYKSNFIEGL